MEVDEEQEHVPSLTSFKFKYTKQSVRREEKRREHNNG